MYKFPLKLLVVSFLKVKQQQIDEIFVFFGNDDIFCHNEQLMLHSCFLIKQEKQVVLSAGSAARDIDEQFSHGRARKSNKVHPKTKVGQNQQRAIITREEEKTDSLQCSDYSYLSSAI